MRQSGPGRSVSAARAVLWLKAANTANSFLRFAPTVAVILNVEEDHLDFFKDINDIIHSFHEFAELTPMNGLVVVNGDDPHAMRSVAGINCKVRTFGHERNLGRLPDRRAR